MDLENIILSEVTQNQKNKYMYSLVSDKWLLDIKQKQKQNKTNTQPTIHNLRKPRQQRGP